MPFFKKKGFSIIHTLADKYKKGVAEHVLAMPKTSSHPFIHSEKEYKDLWQYSVEHPEEFWDTQAQMIPWIKKYTRVWEKPEDTKDSFVGRWFSDGTLNVASVCVDRWAEQHPDEIALTWIGEENQSKRYSYKECAQEVNRIANLLKECQVQKGDRVAIWLPMVPEAIFTQYACAKIGATSVLIFSGFSAKNAEERMRLAGCSVLVTADGGRRKGSVFALRNTLSEECVQSLKKIITLPYTGTPFEASPQEVLWNETVPLMSDVCDPEPMHAEDPLFLLFTSGTTGKPKAIVHSTAGYLVYGMSTMKYAWGIRGLLDPAQDHPREKWFCTADLGWITGHTYLAYAPMALGCEVIMYEGLLTYPTNERLLSILDEYQVSHLYTSPTLLSQLAASQLDVSQASLRSVRFLGSVGEPILPSVWKWYDEKIGRSQCPIIDTYWQTESGGYLLCPIAGTTRLQAGSCSFPFFGIDVKVLKENGEEAAPYEQGSLCIAHSWPGMFRGVYKDQERFFSYFKDFPGYYCTKDTAYKDCFGQFWIVGREDDVIKVAGHRFGSSELEAIVATLSGVQQCAVIGVPHDIKGSSLVVVLVSDRTILLDEVRAHLRKNYGSIATIDRVEQVPDLPKTRSGKITRRLLRQIVLGEKIGDTSTLINPESIDTIFRLIHKKE